MPNSNIQPSTPAPTNQTPISSSELTTISPRGCCDYTQEPHSQTQNSVEFRDINDFTLEGEFINPSLGTRKKVVYSLSA